VQLPFFPGLALDCKEKGPIGEVSMNNEDAYIEFPETYSHRKLNAMYREIPLPDTTSRLLRKYFQAMANL